MCRKSMRNLYDHMAYAMGNSEMSSEIDNITLARADGSSRANILTPNRFKQLKTLTLLLQNLLSAFNNNPEYYFL